jgi:hypothetical protein
VVLAEVHLDAAVRGLGDRRVELRFLEHALRRPPRRRGGKGAQRNRAFCSPMCSEPA